MLLRRVELIDVRSYRHVVLRLDPGVALIVGANAHGKTSLLEAVYRVAAGSSHRVSSDTPLVRHNAPVGYVRVGLQTDAGRDRTVELELRPGQGSRARVDGQETRRLADAVGVLRAVLFAPEDVMVIRGDPACRRRFLDELLSQRRPAYAALRSDYERVVRQRNQLLKSAQRLGPGARGSAARTMQVWTDELARQGGLLLAARIAATHAVAAATRRVYEELADHPDPVGVSYRSSVGFEVAGHADGEVPGSDDLAERLAARLAALGEDERRRRVTLVGPHRDDLKLSLKGLPARDYASHGQAWSLALALRLGSCEVLAEFGDRPVVLLDDVFAELDSERRRRLAGICKRWDQVLVTAAVEDEMPAGDAAVDVWMENGESVARRRHGR